MLFNKNIIIHYIIHLKIYKIIFIIYLLSIISKFLNYLSNIKQKKLNIIIYKNYNQEKTN